MEVIGNTEVQRRVEKLTGWSLADGKLVRDFKFNDFVEAFGFMSKVALVAQRMDHHPEWSNVWNRVSVRLVTHDAGGITALDFDLAQKMSELADE